MTGLVVKNTTYSCREPGLGLVPNTHMAAYNHPQLSS